MTPLTKHVVIVGGGIAGLATAYTLQERARAAGLPLAMTLVEASERLGGVIFTEQVDGFIIEAGPDSLLTQKPWGVELCRTLGIGDRLIGTDDRQRKIYLLWQGRLQPLPEGLMLVIPTRFHSLLRSPLLSWPAKIRIGLEYFLPPRVAAGDESLGAFVRRRLGQEMLEKIAEPLLGGIYAGSLERMSLLATFPRFRELEAKHGGLIRGMLAQRKSMHHPAPSGGRQATSMFMAPRNGMGEIVEAISARLDQVTVLRGRAVQLVLPHHNGMAEQPCYTVHLGSTPPLQADAVVLATPAHVTARVVEEFHPALAAALRAIPYTSTATISLAYRRADVPHPLDGFGFLVGRHEGRRIMAATWTSTKFPQRAPAEHVLIRSFVGGAGHQDLVSLDDAALVHLAREELEESMRIRAVPLLARVYRWEQANPQYVVGHLDHVAALEKMLARYPGLFLTGSAYRGIGVPDCIYHGTRTAEQVMASLASVSA
ncbi:MAG: protoporphyrinogen oxidase [Nitrospinae bacterium]|nr:protoporphyrinogen oxidase [Nitrospinota bacterium]